MEHSGSGLHVPSARCVILGGSGGFDGLEVFVFRVRVRVRVLGSIIQGQAPFSGIVYSPMTA